MQKSILRRVKVGTFCTYVRFAAEALPSFLSLEKEAILKELDVLEGQTNAVRKNEYLERLTKEYVPKLRNILHILKLQLRESDASDANANAIRSYLNAHFKGRHTMEYTTTWVEGLIKMDAPNDLYSGTVFLELIEHSRKLLEIKDLYAEEMGRIASIGRTIDTRMRIIDLLFQALDVAKGCRHRRSTREAAIDAVDTLEGITRDMRKHLPRRKRRKKEGEEAADVAENTADVVGRGAREAEKVRNAAKKEVREAEKEVREEEMDEVEVMAEDVVDRSEVKCEGIENEGVGAVGSRAWNGADEGAVVRKNAGRNKGRKKKRRR